MPETRFSVVIPTREGASTLGHTLRTCLEQEFDDYEVVVCDNFSSPATRQVVLELGSSKIRYVRSDRPLAMSSNWELAVSHAVGEYVCVLGDDDALLPHALRTLDYLLRRLGTPALRWDAAFYLWPDVALPEEANYLRIPTTCDVEMLDSREVMAEVIRFVQCYTRLPTLYNAVVHRSLLENVRRRAGRLFLNRYPDICSGFLIAAAAERYGSVGLPMSIAGLSHKSVGVGHHMIPRQNAVGAEFQRLNAEERVRMRRLVPDLHVFPVVPVADSFQAAKEVLFPDDDTLRLDRETVISQCVRCLRTDSLQHWRDCMATIRATLTDDCELVAWFDANLAEFPPNLTGHLPLRSPVMGFDAKYLHLDADVFGVRDVHGAAQFCDRLLHVAGCDLTSRFEFDPAQRPADRLLAQLQEKEAVIQGLAVEAAEKLRVIREQRALLHAQERQLERYQRLLHYPRRLYKAMQSAAGFMGKLGPRKKSA